MFSSVLTKVAVYSGMLTAVVGKSVNVISASNYETAFGFGYASTDGACHYYLRAYFSEPPCFQRNFYCAHEYYSDVTYSFGSYMNKRMTIYNPFKEATHKHQATFNETAESPGMLSKLNCGLYYAEQQEEYQKTRQLWPWQTELSADKNRYEKIYVDYFCNLGKKKDPDTLQCLADFSYSMLKHFDVDWQKVSLEFKQLLQQEKETYALLDAEEKKKWKEKFDKRIPEFLFLIGCCALIYKGFIDEANDRANAVLNRPVPNPPLSARYARLFNVQPAAIMNQPIMAAANAIHDDDDQSRVARLERVDFDTTNVPHEFRCSISMEIMDRPVLMGDGFYYDQDYVIRYFGSRTTARSVLNQAATIHKNTMTFDAELDKRIEDYVKQIEDVARLRYARNDNISTNTI